MHAVIERLHWNKKEEEEDKMTMMMEEEDEEKKERKRWSTHLRFFHLWFQGHFALKKIFREFNFKWHLKRK